MPIEALPQATVRAIGSTSVISDPCSVVKELLDNALDAAASSVSVEISQDTVDTIQVKDNGHGVPVEDHAFVCKHAFTSKISTIDDLRNVGGTTLGFRGEALASIAEMAGSVIFTTRTASNMVGFQLEYGRNGEIIKSQRIAHPVGSTVRIRHFLKNIPVRRQATLKSSARCLGRIKRLLQDYSMAQPSKRFSVKVMNAKKESLNWSFVPASSPSILDAATKVIGLDAAACCTTQVASTTSETLGTDGLAQSPYKLVAFLPKVDADPSKINGKGQFISIDGRPLSSARGLGHDLVKSFKSCIRAAWLERGAPKSVNDPFMCLQISCPQGSYDVNVEPGKDDVLLEDREILFDLYEEILASHYGALPRCASKNQPEKSTDTSSREQVTGFSLLMARRPLPSKGKDVDEAGNIQTLIRSPAVARQPLASIGLLSPEITPRDQRQRRALDTTVVTSSPDARSSDPRVALSADSATLQENHEVSERFLHGAIRPGLLGNFQKSATNATTGASRSQKDGPHGQSRLTPVSPLRPRQCSPPGQGMGRNPQHENSAKKAARARDRERYGNGALDTWFQRLTQSSINTSSPQTQNQPDAAEPSLSALAEARFNPPSGPLVTSNISGESHHSRKRSPPSEAPRTSVESSPDQAATKTIQAQTRPIDSGRGYPVLENWAASVHEGFVSARSLDLEQALDFERRKREVNRKVRTQSTRPNPAIRKVSLVRAGVSQSLAAGESHPTRGEAVGFQAITHLAADDPRAYLISHQMNDGPGRRARTSKLPLENISEGDKLYERSVVVETEVSEVAKAFHDLASSDQYTRKNDENTQLVFSDAADASAFLSDRLIAIVSRKYQPEAGSSPCELRNEIQAALTNHEKRLQAIEAGLV
ncbi:Uncharacterized protein PECH_001976 [Penicillium ucsense]|uniref:DNA mismatch repair protein S5 domain-containing protein n=1 Tax=Penicillium ucsense TaxID=2839758 RepID=A0A8J8W082_9EURO|nr:Uncharacterized protein PECM_002014 [Penicillium ucsense]KAF7731333.1 Uncharacterized protein PECH_001976 [Penicillium ucsense]